MVQYHVVRGDSGEFQQPPKPEQDQGRQRDATLQLMFFVAAVCCIVAGIIGTICTIVNPLNLFEPLDLLDELYLIVFGVVLFVMDAPLNLRGILNAKNIIGRYCRLITRITGKGLFCVFLGCFAFGTMWEEDASGFLSVILCSYIAGLGIFMVMLGITKSIKLNAVRLELQQAGASS